MDEKLRRTVCAVTANTPSLCDLVTKVSNFYRFYAFGVKHIRASTACKDTPELNEARLRSLYQSIPRKTDAEYFIIATTSYTACFIFGDLTYRDAIQGCLKNVSGNSCSGDPFCFQDEAAVDHLAALITGLDDIASESGHMLCQVIDAYKIAKEQGAIGIILHRLLDTALGVSKKVLKEDSFVREARLADEISMQTAGEAKGNKVSNARIICDETLANFMPWYIHYQEMRPAIEAVICTFDEIRIREIERNKKRFSELDCQQLEVITKSIMQKVLAIPVVRLRDATPDYINYTRDIRLLKMLFTRDV